MTTPTTALTAQQVAKIEDWMLSKHACLLTRAQRDTARQMLVRDFRELNADVGSVADGAEPSTSILAELRKQTALLASIEGMQRAIPVDVALFGAARRDTLPTSKEIGEALRNPKSACAAPEPLV